MRLFGIIILLTLYFGQGIAQYTLIPDAEFELRLIAQGIDTEGVFDGQVLTDDIDHIMILDLDTPFPEVDPLINDLTGIQDFSSLEDLYISGNNLTTIDLSNNLNLKLLVCKQNNLSQLDLSANVLLEVLDAANCFTGTCNFENTFTFLNLSSNVMLNFIFLSNNNTLKELDLSNNGMLLTAGISRNTALNSLNLKNGNNLILDNLTVLENPMLGCIDVDDPVAATEGILPPYNNWDVEPGVIFSKDCTLGIEDVTLLNQISLHPNPTRDYFKIDLPFDVALGLIEIYDVAGRKVVETGFEDTAIDVSELRTGIYFVRINSELGTVTKRLIKE